MRVRNIVLSFDDSFIELRAAQMFFKRCPAFNFSTFDSFIFYTFDSLIDSKEERKGK